MATPATHPSGLQVNGWLTSGDAESGLEVVPGRPNIAEVLQQAADAYPTAPAVGVYTAGTGGLTTARCWGHACQRT